MSARARTRFDRFQPASSIYDPDLGIVATLRALICRDATVLGLLVLLTAITGIRLLFSGNQYAIADLTPFSPNLLASCLLPYQSVGLGRDNPGASPSLCR